MTGAGCGLDGGGPWLGVRDVLDGCGGLRACVSVVALLRVSALVCTVCLSSVSVVADVLSWVEI